MMDHALINQDSEERDVKCESRSNSSAEENGSCSSSNETKKTCTDCGTSKTPLWRGGPAGPKSLCNACGIKSRKRKQSAALNSGSQEKKQRKTHKITKKHVDDNMKSSGSRNDYENRLGDLLKGKSLDLRKENVMKRKVWRMLGEDEQAAMLLMSLSSGSVYAQPCL